MRKPFAELGLKQKGRLTNEIYEFLLARADELEIDATTLICYLGYRANYIGSKSTARKASKLQKAS